MDAAQLIVSARQTAGISQAELARRAGVSRSVMCVYESGKREPGANTLLRILTATGNKISVMPDRDRTELERSGHILEQVIEFAEALPYIPKKEIEAPILRDLLK